MNTIDFTYKGQEYRLGFSRQSVKTLEAQGFVIENIGKMPASMIPTFFYGAFALNHRKIKRKLVDEIWDAIGNKDELIMALAELYAETIEDLMSDGDEAGETITWERSE